MNEAEDREVVETEGEVLAKEAGTDSPFDGYGRPFSDDQLGMSEFYYHDNPANNVGPYSGPNSYSINTVTPYNPPHQDEENPGQNVGVYNPPADKPQNPGSPEQDEDPTATPGLKAAFKTWSNQQWFDGTSTSIYSRSIEAEQLRRQAHVAGDFVLEDELREHIDILNKTAAEYDDSVLHEAMENVPGGTVALEYDDLVDGGLVDVTSFLSTGAHAVAKEASEYDWDLFQREGARNWITQRLAENPGLIKHEVMAREAAIDYAKDKTMVLMDPNRRADIIDGFITNAERFRREAASRLLESEETTAERRHTVAVARMAQVEFDEQPEEFLPGAYTDLSADYDEDGYLNIGEDDGSYMYEEARSAISASRNRLWEEFTTEGARDWFFDEVAGSPMSKHDDITFRAAKKYATDQASLVPDIALKNEIVRAFTESVEFLRQAHIQREAHREVPAESDIDEFFGDEQLW
jgi:hypothetical protein